MADNQPALVFRVAATITELKKNLAEGKDQIEITQQAFVKMAASYDGSRIIQQAGATAAAIQQIGGVTNLTAAEQAKANVILDAALDKYRALGKEAPPGMQALADATRHVEEETTKVEPAVSGVNQAFGSLSAQIQANIVGFVSAQAIISGVSNAVRALTAFVMESVTAYAESEGAQVKLIAALHQHSLATPEVIDQYNALATTFQQTTVYADENINAMEGLLTQVGGLMPSAMAGALKASSDLAAGLGIDLQAATMLVAKAAAGHTETLGRYGITVNEAEIATKGFDAVLEAINRQFGGQAQAAIETYTGKVKQIENSWNNVQEALGKIILTDPLVVQALNRIADAAAKADKDSTSTSNALVGLAADFGLIDKGTAIALISLTEYTDGLNELEKTQKRLAAMPSPFAKTAADSALPAITSGLKLANDLWIAHEKEVKANAEALEKFTASMVEINAVGQGWQGTLETIDGEVAEAVKYYLEAGVAQDKLASAYGLTAAQVKSVSSELREEQAALKIQAESLEQVTKLWDEFNQLASAGGSTFDNQVAAIDRWAEDLQAKAQKAGTDTKEFYEALTALWNEKLHQAAQNAETGIEEVTAAARSAFAQMNDAVMGLETSFYGWNDAIMNTTRALDGTLQSVEALQKAREKGNSLDISHAARDPEIMALLHAGWSLENAESIKLARQWGYTPKLYDELGNPETTPSKGERVPGYERGVQNAPGGWAIVGEKGPEPMYVPPGANIYPHGTPMGSSITIAAGAIVIQYPIMRDARALAELTDVMSAGLLKKLVGLGLRLPSGA